MDVSGTAVVPADAPAGMRVDLHVEVRDVALADVPSVLLASRTYRGVVAEPGARLPFTVDVEHVGDRAVVSLRVHADVSGDGRVATGDLLSTQHHPVPAADLVVPLTVMT